MSSDLILRGVYVPLITPFDEAGAVATDAIGALIEEYVAQGATGIVALGTTGESAALNADEKAAVVATCSQVCAELRVSLIVGTGTNNTKSSIEANVGLADIPGVVAALGVVPYYVRPSEAGIVEHFKQVAAASPVPIILYNIPYRTGRALGARSVLELAGVRGIAGIKQAVGSIDTDTLEILRGAPEGFAVLAGDDPFIYPNVLMGAVGAICASAHVATARFVAMVECGIAGKVDEGRVHAEALLPVVQACFVEPNPAVFKGVLHAQGRIPTPNVRLPLLPASLPAIEAALAAIAAAC